MAAPLVGVARLISVKEGEAHSGREVIQRQYELVPPLGEVQWVMVSSSDSPDEGRQSMVFSCDEQGEILDWNELVCYPAMVPFMALNELGYFPDSIASVMPVKLAN